MLLPKALRLLLLLVDTNAAPVKVTKAACSNHASMPIIHVLADVTTIVAAQGSTKHVMPIICSPAGASVGTFTDGAALLLPGSMKVTMITSNKAVSAYPNTLIYLQLIATKTVYLA